jgi:hypothetical protein
MINQEHNAVFRRRFIVTDVPRGAGLGWCFLLGRMPSVIGQMMSAGRCTVMLFSCGVTIDAEPLTPVAMTKGKGRVRCRECDVWEYMFPGAGQLREIRAAVANAMR